jgi:3-methyladenine DNA glycosylase AlkC
MGEESGAPALKGFVDDAVVDRLADRFAAVQPGFDSDGFRSAAKAELGDLELKKRIAHIATRLAEKLPAHYPDAVAVVVDAADHPDPPIGGWEAWPLNTFVELRGAEWPEDSLDAMERLTRHASSEFALRPLLEHHPETTFARLERWATHPDEAVRRLVSEGTRPLLPWGKRVEALRKDPEPGLALITRLARDPSQTVRRSVANHLNDVSKYHPERAVEVAGEWLADGSDQTRSLVSHALRTLVKRGDSGAFAVLGFATNAEVDVMQLTCDPPRVTIGERATLTARLRCTADEPCRMVADWVVHYVKTAGSTSPKVFKGKVLDLEPGQEVELRRRLALVDMSTRTHHPGTHRVVLQVAGSAVAETSFELLGRA